ncbi:hypothetical protein FTX61_12690 [Nitriliruptoraceae bacterium ZYF776]|nr:hypothetical protein [Profundirhabdus halotolerans]
MDELPTAKDLRVAARGATIIAYAAGLAGVAAGTLMLRDGELAMAVLLWVVTFAVGATLMGIALVVRAMSGVTARLQALDANVRGLQRDRATDLPPPADWRH